MKLLLASSSPRQRSSLAQKMLHIFPVILLLLVQACGQKGDLYLPPESADPVVAQQVNTEKKVSRQSDQSEKSKNTQ
jgi:predicted small lipoprotein YifL